jgi:hypothetical protein
MADSTQLPDVFVAENDCNDVPSSEYPTAVQPAVTQLTPLSNESGVPVSDVGIAVSTQLPVVFEAANASILEPLSKLPTAVHPIERQLTEFNCASVPLSVVGKVLMTHVPLELVATIAEVETPSSTKPTAVHEDPKHDTPFNVVVPAPLGNVSGACTPQTRETGGVDAELPTTPILNDARIKEATPHSNRVKVKRTPSSVRLFVI